MLREEYLIDFTFTKDFNNYIEMYDEDALFVLHNVIQNWLLVRNEILNHTIIIKNAKGVIEKYTPTDFDIQFCEADSGEEFLDGTILLDGAVRMREESDPMKLTISARNFRIYEVGGIDMVNDKEVYIVEKGMVVNSAEVRVKNDGVPGKMMTSVIFDYGKEVE